MTTIDPRLVQQIIEMVDTRFEQLMRQQPYTAYGVIDSVDTANRRVNVLLSGDTNVSAGFSYPSGFEPVDGALVRVVIDPRGDRYVSATPAAAPQELTAARLRLTTTTDVELSSTGHAFQVGSSAGQNVSIDNNEILSRNNGAVADLFLQNESGAPLQIGPTGSRVSVLDGTISATGAISSDAGIFANEDGEQIVLSGNNYIEMNERTAGVPGAAGTGQLRLFADVNAGKVRLRVRFPGGTQTIITEA